VCVCVCVCMCMCEYVAIGAYFLCHCMLQYDAVCCNVLQRVAACCSVLKCATVCCSVKWCVAVSICSFSALRAQEGTAYVIACCSVMQCMQRVAVCCSVVQTIAVCCSVLQCIAVRCSESQCAAVCCSVMQGVAVCCSVLQCVAACCSAFHVFSSGGTNWGHGNAPPVVFPRSAPTFENFSKFSSSYSAANCRFQKQISQTSALYKFYTVQPIADRVAQNLEIIS